MKYLVLLTPTAGRELSEFAPHLVPEMQAVWSSYKKGELREMYFSASKPPVVSLVYEVGDRAELDRLIDALPMVEVGLLDRQVVHLGPWLPFESIFDKSLIEISK